MSDMWLGVTLTEPMSTTTLEVGADSFFSVHLVFELPVLLLLLEIPFVPLYNLGVCDDLRRIEIENLESVERGRTREPNVRLALLECPGEVNPHALQRLSLGFVDTYGPRQDERNLPSRSFHFSVDVLNGEFYGNHHHPPTDGPVDNRPKMRALQDMKRDVSVGTSGCVGPQIVVCVYKTYVGVPVDGFSCGQKVDNLANGPVDQLPMDEILDKHHLAADL